MSNDLKNKCLINGVVYRCRTCLEPARKVFSLTDRANSTKTWRDLLKDIAQLQTNDDELLPKTMCYKCLEKLKKSYDFVLQIHSVNKKYSQLLSNDGTEVDKFSDCLAESAITLPLEQYIPDIKLEEDLIAPFDIVMNPDKLPQENEENDDTDDPFTETFDEEFISTLGKMEEDESAIVEKCKSGETTTKRNRRKNVKEANQKKLPTPVKRTRKPKMTKPVEETLQTEEIQNIDENDANDAKEPIICGICAKTFFTIHTYQRHRQREHASELKEERNKCPICSRVFRNNWYMVDHIKVVHDKLKPYKCSHCTKSFATGSAQRIHELSHTNDFPFACEYCDRRFRLNAKLKVHLEIHTTKPELLCPICKRSQKSEEEMEAHIKNHDDNRLQCPSCGHLFRKRSNLNDHYSAVHLKLRPYKCEVCEMTFGDRKSRRVHQRSHFKNKNVAT